MPVGLQEEVIQMILQKVEPIERIIMGSTEAIVIFEQESFDDTTIELACQFDGYKLKHQDQDYKLKIEEAKSIFLNKEILKTESATLKIVY